MSTKSKTTHFAAYVLLIAVTIQAITPDTYNLVSSRLLHLLEPMLACDKTEADHRFDCCSFHVIAEVAPLGSDSVPLEDQDQEPVPDESCPLPGPLKLELRSRRTDETRESRYLIPLPSKLTLAFLRLAPVQFSTSIARTCSLVCALCCLIC
jgi:hypothetical protein